jgi:ATP-binding cassette subfamily F protein uup
MGGYSDFLKIKERKIEIKSSTNKKNIKTKNIQKIKNKLSFKFKYELENLPKQIEDLQLKIHDINNELKNSNLYLENVDRFNKITNEISDLKESLTIKEDRWLKLLEMEEKMKNI